MSSRLSGGILTGLSRSACFGGCKSSCRLRAASIAPTAAALAQTLEIRTTKEIMIASAWCCAARGYRLAAIRHDDRSRID